MIVNYIVGILVIIGLLTFHIMPCGYSPTCASMLPDVVTRDQYSEVMTIASHGEIDRCEPDVEMGYV